MHTTVRICKTYVTYSYVWQIRTNSVHFVSKSFNSDTSYPCISLLINKETGLPWQPNYWNCINKTTYVAMAVISWLPIPNNFHRWNSSSLNVSYANWPRSVFLFFVKTSFNVYSMYGHGTILYASSISVPPKKKRKRSKKQEIKRKTK